MDKIKCKNTIKKIWNNFHTKRCTILSILLCIAMVLTLMPVMPATEAYAYESSGDGTESNPYLIRSQLELINLRDAVNDGTKSTRDIYFKLMTDIDLSEINNWIPIGNSSHPFEGKFDGGFHIIKNLTIVSSNSYLGLFGKLQNAYICNVGLEAVNVRGNTDVAGLAGNAKGGSIDRCYVTGSISGAGGIGGILGSTHSNESRTAVNNCYVRASLSGTGFTMDTAGISGWNASESIEVNNSYCSCTGEKHALAGWSDGEGVNNSNLKNCFFDKTLSPSFNTDLSREEIARTADQLKTQDNYTDWDFTDIWEISLEKNGGYPTLKGFSNVGLGGAPGAISVTVKDNSDNLVTDAIVSIKNTTSPNTETTLNHQGSGVYSNTVTTSGATYDIYVYGSKVTGIQAVQSGTLTVSITVNVSPRSNLLASNFTFAPPSDLTYSSAQKEATVSSNGITCGTIRLDYYDSNATKLSGAPINAGTYSVKIHVDEDSNYNEATDLTDSSWQYTIQPKSLNVSVSDVTINKGQSIPYLNVNVTGFEGTETAGTLSGFQKPTASIVGTEDTLDTTNNSFTVSYSGGNATSNYQFDYNTNVGLTINTVNIIANDYSTGGKNLAEWQTENIYISPINGYTLISSNGNTWNSQIELSDSSNGRKTFYLKKSDGTVTEGKTINYKVDTVAPTVQIKVKSNLFAQLFNTITFGMFFKNTLDVQIIGSDATSNIAKIEYQKVADTSSYNINGTWSTLNSDGNYTFRINSNSKSLIYAKVTDVAGNVTIVNSEGIVVYTDSAAVTSQVTFTKTGTEDKVANVTLNGNTVKELKLNGNVIESSYYTVGTDGSISLKAAYLNTLASDTYIVTVSYNPLGESYVSGTDNEAPADTTFSLIVSRKSLGTGEFTYSAPSNLTYNGSSKHAQVSYKTITDGSSITVEYWKGSTKLSGAPTDYGEYTVKISTAATDNYAAISSLQVGTFSIEKADQSAPTGVSKNDTTSLANNDGKIADVSSLMEYQKSGTTGWQAITGTEVTGLTTGTYLVRLKSDNNHNAGATTSVTIVSYTGTKENTPEAEFSASTRTLTGTEVGQKYCVDNGEWKNVVADLSQDVTMACTIKIYKPGDGVHTLDSDVQTINVTKKTVPELGKTDETIKGKVDGTITGTDSTVEQKISESWTSVLDITELAAGTYSFRTKATGTELESDTVNVTIGEGRMLNVTIPTGKGYTVSSTDSSEVGYNGTYSFRIDITAGYNSDNMVVKAGSTVLTAVNGTYTVINITSDTAINITGVADTTKPTAQKSVNAAGNVIISTEVNEGAPATKIENSLDELKKKVMSDEEIELVENGQDANVYLEIKDTSILVSAEEKERIVKSMGDNTLGMYLDISLWVKVGDNEAHKVSSPKGKIKVSIKIPQDLISTDKSVNRSYSIIRVHEGVTTILDGEFDSKTGYFTFETDLFSTYALIYEDTNTERSSAPKTGDNMNIVWLWVLIASISGSGIAIIGRRKTRNYK